MYFPKGQDFAQLTGCGSKSSDLASHYHLYILTSSVLSLDFSKERIEIF